MRHLLRAPLAAWHRGGSCRRGGHAWTDMANPPACAHCGRTRTSAAPQGASIAA